MNSGPCLPIRLEGGRRQGPRQGIHKLKFEIRRYRPSDLGDVLALHSVALQDAGALAPPGPWDDDLNDIESFYLVGSGEFLVGLIGDQLVAMGALRKIDEEVCEIKRMRVHPEFQRRGFGQQILDSLEARAREVGYSILRLDTTAQQTPAQALYRKNGYREVERKMQGRYEVL